MNKLKANRIDHILDTQFAPGYHQVYFRKDVDELINELSNIIFSLEQSLNDEWKRILRKDIKKIQQLRKKGIIYGKYINDNN